MADVVVYALLVVGLLSVLCLLISIPLRAGLVGVKYGLFVTGFAQIGLSVVRLWPSDPDDLAVADEPTTGDDSRFQRTVQRLIPVKSLRLRPHYRIPTPLRLAAAGIVTLLASLSLELLFGVPG